jgi:hypothetical protein
MKKYFLLSIILLGRFVANAQLFVATGESVSVVSNDQLFLQEDLQNNGTIARLTINNSNTISISGIGTINYLKLNKSAGTTSITGGQQTITNVYTPASGTLNTGGKLVLSSNNLGSARIETGNAAGGYLSGNVLVQRYIPGGFRKFRFIGHPFDAPLNVTELTDDIDITGNLNNGNTNLFTTTATNNPSAFYYDESLDNGFYNGNTSTNSGWVAYTGNTPTNIGIGQGLRVLIRGSKGQTNSLTGGAYTPDEVTLSVNGQLRQGDFIQNLQYSNANTNKGWNLISNPYASNIDWLLVGRTNVDNAVYTYLPRVDGGRYASYINGSSSNGGSNFIESSSSFFVHANGNSPFLTWQETNKVSEEPTNSNFKLTLVKTNRYSFEVKNTATNFTDEVVIRFGEDEATDRFDAEFDAYNLPGSSHDLYVLDNKNIAYSIYHGSELKNASIEKRIIQLGLANAVMGTYTFTAKELNPLTLNNKAILKDNYTNSQTEITEEMTYLFEINADSASQKNNRFSIIFNPESNIPYTPFVLNIQVAPNPTKDMINLYYNQPKAAESFIKIVDASGKELYQKNLGTVSNGNISIHTKNWDSGTYYLSFISGKQSIVRKVIKN